MRIVKIGFCYVSYPVEIVFIHTVNHDTN